ncbi:MAG TPA: hypothetical protein VN828_10080 [Acidobacteriaceae bacterium]|nr:hypothetical protein [Acidobacteriaceae bacterium]
MVQLWVTVIQTSLMERPFTPTEQDCPRGITRRNEGAGAAAPLRVDAHKPANSFDPDKSLGSSMDELSIGVIQKIYTPEMVRQWLAAGWGPITCRNYTELAIVAWQWNGEPTSRFYDQGGPRRQSEVPNVLSACCAAKFKAWISAIPLPAREHRMQRT